MKTSTKRVLSLLGSAGFFVVALMIYALLIVPTYNDLNKMRGELGGRETVFENQSEIIRKVKELLAEYQGSFKIQDSISFSLPTSPSASSIVAQVQSIAQVSGLLVQSINLQTQALRPSKISKDVKALGLVEVSLRLIGPYEGLKSFLNGIATNVRVMDVVDARTEVSNKNNPNALTHNIIINAYYQAE